MKKLVYSAIALSVTSAGALASDSDWSTLDQEIEALTASSVLDTTGPKVSGRVRSYYQNSGDIDTDGVPGPPTVDLADFNTTDARLKVTGTRGDYGYTVQLDFADGMALLDAFVDFPIGGQVNGRFGQFKSGFSRSGLLSSGNIFFIDRNIVGSMWAGRSDGFQLNGEFDQLGWWLTVQDGVDSAGDEYLFTGRVAFDLLGDGATNVEGAFGGTEEPSATAAIAIYDDGGVLMDGDGTLIEFHGGTNVYSFGVDILDIGKSGVIGGGQAWSGFGPSVAPDTTPFSVAGTYMLSPDTWELGIRFQDYDNLADEDKIDIGVANYLDGHNLKWTFQYTTTSSNTLANEIDWIGIQVQLGF